MPMSKKYPLVLLVLAAFLFLFLCEEKQNVSKSIDIYLIPLAIRVTNIVQDFFPRSCLQDGNTYLHSEEVTVA